ncbi:hypothetical protein [Bacillus methanolicus]|nr:hypothetical protein [Bacillus methanolicus]EIJ83815.1 hypothetical protein MGA3_00910 [Bacillus methanolicus MGA3]
MNEFIRELCGLREEIYCRDGFLDGIITEKWLRKSGYFFDESV